VNYTKQIIRKTY